MATYATRVQAVEQTVQSWLWKPFVWGEADCIKLAAVMARALGNKISMLKAGHYSSEVGAMRACKRAGYDKLVDAIDAQPGFERINLASVIVGDLIGLPLPDAPEGWPAITIWVGNGRVFGFFDFEKDNQIKACIIEPKNPYDGIVWRIPSWLP